ncbi:hypothetical protein SAICODRAFT_83032 [Saitoella complicata NRRL Y-17804]|nr:uncharacterized protein SAICODRAFT_83032 [Saitoella complicata NRRL Y-17804]ODQ51599.1 hypothetical protein SAICODRAFT_83032 [Saitoella complicata NRRL Y-17804]
MYGPPYGGMPGYPPQYPNPYGAPPIVPGMPVPVPGMPAPGMAPPGMGAPGFGPPGMMNNSHNDARGPQRPFVPPANMPNINLNAPVIHLGTGGGGRLGLGATPNMPQHNNNNGHTHLSNMVKAKEIVQPARPPTVEEALNTLFVGAIPSELEDEWVEKILRAVAKLKEWRRARAADGSLRSFGFAEYDDPEHTQRAITVLENLEIPPATEDGKPTKLIITTDEQTRVFLESYDQSRTNKNPQKDKNMIITSRNNLAKVLEDFADPSKRQPAAPTAEVKTEDSNTPAEEVVTIPLGGDEELGDIPQEQREAVAREITAFRERASRRDKERAQAVEDAERRRANFGRNGSMSSNAIPVGPRGISAPTGPKVKEELYVSKVNIPATEEEAALSDDELERRRKEKKDRDLEIQYVDRERRWLNRERTRTLALERELARERDLEARELQDKDAIRQRLAEWDDDKEREMGAEEYYRDKSNWLANRAVFRAREGEMDAQDREAERRELEMEGARGADASNQAEAFLNNIAAEVGKAAPQQQQPATASAGPGPIRLQFGVKKAPETTSRTMGQAEALLEDDEEEDKDKQKRVLVPLTYEGTNVEDEETKARRLRQLVSSIPSDKEGLWSWPVKWDKLTDALIEEDIKPFTTKKIIEYLGVQDDDLIKFTIDHLRKKGSAEDLEKELEMALDEDAEVFVKKIWRLIILTTEKNF